MKTLMNYAATILSTALEGCVENMAAKADFFLSVRVEVNEKLIVAVVILIIL